MGSGDTLDLLRSWHGGDRRALDELIERNLPWVQEYVHRRLGDKLRRMGETLDFVQGAMIGVLEYGPQFEVSDEDQFRALVARIVENELRGQHRYMHRQKRHADRQRQLPSDTVLGLDPPARSVTRPSQRAHRQEEYYPHRRDGEPASISPLGVRSRLHDPASLCLLGEA